MRRFVVSKFRVVSLIVVSVLRFELMVVVVVIDFGVLVVVFLELSEEIIFWSDSSNVLYWIINYSRVFKFFVVSRVGEI